MTIKGFYLMPHPPIIIPDVGKGEEKKINSTVKAMEQIGKDIKNKAPSTIIIVTPHGTMFEDAIAITYEDCIKGSLENFAALEFSMKLNINKNISSKIYELSMTENIPVVMVTNSLLEEYNSYTYLDHGSMVPLYFVNKYYKDYNIVHITYAPLNDIELYKFGMIIEQAVKHLHEDVVFIASGDLSHRLKAEGPYDYSPFGEKFDNEFLNNLENGDVLSIFNMDKETICQAGECGRKSIIVMLGALDNTKFKGELLNYEGTFGVGYGTMIFNPISDESSKLNRLEKIRLLNYEKKLATKDPYIKLAIESLTTYLSTGKVLKKFPSYVTEDMKNNKNGVFVSLKKNGVLRGCIGTIFPATDCIASEIIRNAVDAGVNDPRFFEVEEDELPDIDLSVDVLTEPEPATKNQLDPKEYGVIVSSNGRTGLLLPNLEEVNTVDEQLSIALKKADIKQDEEYLIERFKVIRHSEY